MTFTVAILGRPNVGKSTLFNRLVGKRLALVDDLPGVTRDRREGEGRIGETRFRVIDTAGLEEAFDDSLEARMRQQTEAALQEADVALMMVDARAGVTPLDKHFADWLRTQPTPIILLANKCEGRAAEAGRLEAYELGLGEPIGVSAEHGEGLIDLNDALLDVIPEETLLDDDEGEKPLMLAIVGRPNAGKSTLINRLIGEDRLLTGPEAGITRDAISVNWTWRDRAIRLFDTAGMRRKARVDAKLEKLAVADGRRALQFAEIVVLLVDATQPLEKQDLAIARQTLDEGRALVIGINKWDLVENANETMEGIRYRLENQLAQARGVPIVTLSAVTGRGVDKLMPAVLRADKAWNIRVTTAKLNQWLDEMTAKHPPPLVRGRRFRIRYMTQAKSRPPTFALFTSSGGDLPESYERYLVNGMREHFGLKGVPVRINLRKSHNPYEGRAKKRRLEMTDTALSHRGPTKPMGMIQSLRIMQDNVIDLYPPYIFDKDFAVQKYAFQTFIVINRPDMIKEMLVDKTDIYSKGRLNRQILGPALGNGLLTAEGDFWKRQRRIAAPAFHFRKLQILADIMAECSVTAADRLEDYADTGRHIDIAKEMMRLTMEIVARTLFSSDIVRSIDELGEAVGVLIENLGRLSLVDILGLPEWMPRFRDPRVKQALTMLDVMIFGIIEQRRLEGESAREDLLQMLLDARDPETGEGMSDRQLRDEVMTLFAAGHETTAQALTWAFYLLSQHPSEEAKLHAELDDVLGGRIPGFDDMKDLERTRMVFDETLRIFPPAFSISRTAEKPDVLCGDLEVPKGAIVSASPYITHRNPKIWPEPDRFDPERFADHEVHGRHKHAYFPFGAGQRICIGSGFAQTEGRLALAILAQRFVCV